MIFALSQIKNLHKDANWPDTALLVEGLLRSWDTKIQRLDPEYNYSDLGEIAQEIIEQTQFNNNYRN